MGLFNFDRPVKMKASDQFGFSTGGSVNNTGNVRLAGNPYYSVEDKKNVIGVSIKKAKDPNYQPKAYELESIK